MRLRQIFEENTKVAAFALGRLNPATTGHELLVNAIKEQPGDHFLFLTDRAPKLPDNPLTSEEKLDWARKSFPDINVELAQGISVAAHKLYQMGYRKITFLEGEDKLYKILVNYNGKTEGKKGPIEFPYKFDKIDYVQLTRNADADDATGMSGTKLRGYVANNDLEGFKSGVTDPAKPYAEQMFKKLQGIMGVDSVEEDQVAELKLFKNKIDNDDPKRQDPNKVKVMDYIASRNDGKEHFLSFYRKGTAYSGNLLWITPTQAKKFLRKWDDNPDYHEQMKRALTSVQTSANLLKSLDIGFEIRKAR